MGDRGTSAHAGDNVIDLLQAKNALLSLQLHNAQHELKLWREVGHFESDHSEYCDCKRCKMRAELASIVNKEEE
jgi:hypothetical protein